MTEPKPLTRIDLDAMTCSNPNCNCGFNEKLFIHPKCHIGKGITAFYENGILTFSCKKCDKLICKIAVKERKADG